MKRLAPSSRNLEISTNLQKILGSKQFVHQPRQEQTPNAVSLSMEDVRQFLREHSRHSYFVALSVFFVYPFCLLSDLFRGCCRYFAAQSSDVLDASGIILMFVFIAIGVGMLVYSNVCMGHWKHLEEGNFVTDFATTDYIHHEMEHYKKHTCAPADHRYHAVHLKCCPTDPFRCGIQFCGRYT